MCNLYSITINQAAIVALFRVINRYVGNLPPMPGVFPDYPAPAVRRPAPRRTGLGPSWSIVSARQNQRATISAAIIRRS